MRPNMCQFVLSGKCSYKTYASSYSYALNTAAWKVYSYVRAKWGVLRRLIGCIWLVGIGWWKFMCYSDIRLWRRFALAKGLIPTLFIKLLFVAEIDRFTSHCLLVLTGTKCYYRLQWHRGPGSMSLIGWSTLSTLSWRKSTDILLHWDQKYQRSGYSLLR